MSPPVRIERCTEPERLSRLDRRIFQEDGCAPQSGVPGWRLTDYRALLSGPTIQGWLAASVSGEELGFAVMRTVADEGEVFRLGVLQSWRRRGIAGLLLDTLFEGACRQGVRTIFLEVRAGNAGARGLYRAYGFAEVGRRLNYYEHPAEDALILQRPVAA